jgi:hypothetical protein
LRAEGRTLDAALGFLLQAAAALPGLPGAERVTVYDAVPMTIVKVANVHRARSCCSRASRSALQHALRAWQPQLRALKGVLRWSIEVDPLDIERGAGCRFTQPRYGPFPSAGPPRRAARVDTAVSATRFGHAPRAAKPPPPAKRHGSGKHRSADHGQS